MLRISRYCYAFLCLLLGQWLVAHAEQLKPQMDRLPSIASKSVVKLSPSLSSPQQPQITADALGYWLVDQAVLSQSQRVIGSVEGAPFFAWHGAVSISGLHHQLKWAIYRIHQEFVRGEQSVWALKRIAIAELVTSNEVASTVKITQLNQEIMLGDIALPIAQVMSAQQAVVKASSKSPTAIEILGSAEGLQYVGSNQLVVINRGQYDGVQRGNRFELYNSGLELSSAQVEVPFAKRDAAPLPQRLVGQMQVVRPHRYFSLAIITASSEAIGIKTIVRTEELLTDAD